MSGIEIAIGLVLGLIVNELTDVSPWVGRKLVAWSARQRYGQTPRAAVRAEELAAVINDRPGKLFKLGTGLRFASAALAFRARRLISPKNADSSAEDIEILEGVARPFLPLVEPSVLVARYLFPTERFRGEWRRHWIHLTKGMLITLLYGVLGAIAVTRQIQPRYAGWLVAAVVAATLVVLACRLGGWYFSRFVITNKRLMSTEGLFVRRVAMIPLMRVVDLRYTQSPLARLLNYGTFTLESASRRNALRKIVNLPNPGELYLRLVEEMYEPQAVEARLGRDEPQTGEAWLESIDDDGGIDETSGIDDFGEKLPSDPVMMQREILHRVANLSAALTSLAEAIQQLSPPPPAPASQTPGGWDGNGTGTPGSQSAERSDPTGAHDYGIGCKDGDV